MALETALVTHGLPSPFNLETAADMEAAVRGSGAVPCTIGVLRGEINVGLDREQLTALAEEESPLKLGLRELPYAAAMGRSGGTTVAATAHLAHRYGIRVFATGGIGGVHRNGHNTFDISGDLPVLGRTPLTVVSSGAKAILDLKLTLEYMETAGIAPVGYRTSFFPAFYAAVSPYRTQLCVESAADVARTAAARDALGIPAALLVCNPVSLDNQIPWEHLTGMIAQVCDEMGRDGIEGQDVTPYMLRRLFVLSRGQTLKANLSLLVDNARLGGEIAVALAEGRDN